jgi:hypothetical protein
MNETMGRELQSASRAFNMRASVLGFAFAFTLGLTFRRDDSHRG